MDRAFSRKLALGTFVYVVLVLLVTLYYPDTFKHDDSSSESVKWGKGIWFSLLALAMVANQFAWSKMDTDENAELNVGV